MPPKNKRLRVLDLTVSTKRARQFNSFNDFWILAIYCNNSYGFKNVRNVIEMALKSLFLPQNDKSHPAAGGSAPRPLCDTLELHRFVQHGSKLDHFPTKIYFWFKLPTLSKILVALLVALWLQKRAKWDWNGVKIAVFRRKITKLPRRWGLCTQASLWYAWVALICLARGLN